MKGLSNSKAVFIFGTPGSGKGLQATLLSLTKDFFHFDTGKFGESIVFDPKLQKNKIIRRQRMLFESGKLFDPEWTLQITSRRIQELGSAGLNIVFSGSPRSLYEAFNPKNPPGIFNLLPKFYKKSNSYIFLLANPENVSVRRNTARIVCSLCRLPVIYPEKKSLNICSFCGAKLVKRTLDTVATMKVRLKEYHERTEPILKELKRRGYVVVKIDARPAPQKIFQQILRTIQ